MVSEYATKVPSNIYAMLLLFTYDIFHHSYSFNPSLAKREILPNSVDPDQLASDLDLHCLWLNMLISIKTPDHVI